MATKTKTNNTVAAPSQEEIIAQAGNDLATALKEAGDKVDQTEEARLFLKNAETMVKPEKGSSVLAAVQEKLGDTAKDLLSNTAGNITYEASAHNAEEFEKEMEQVRDDLINWAVTGDTTMTTRLAVACCDMVVLNREGKLPLVSDDAPYTFNFGDRPTKDHLKVVQNFFEMFLTRGEGAAHSRDRKAGEDLDKERQSILAIPHVRNLMPYACQCAMLMLYGIAEFGWYPRGKNASLRQEVKPFADLPEGERNGSYVQCVATKYNRIRPYFRFSTKNKDGNWEKISEKPNHDASLVYLSRNYAEILCAQLFNPLAVTENEEGYLVKSAIRERETGNQGKTGNGEEKGKTEETKAPEGAGVIKVTDMTKAITAKATDKKTPMNNSEITSIVEATTTVVERVVEEAHSKGDMLPLLAGDLFQLYKLLESVISYDDDGNVQLLNKSGKVIKTFTKDKRGQWYAVEPKKREVA